MYYLIAGILVFVIYGSFLLSLRDHREKNVCPKVLSIPACYWVAAFFIGAFAVHLLQVSPPYWYFGLLSIPFLLALSGTITELRGKVICPRTAGGTPMCFLSLGFCTLLIALKFFTF